MVEGLAENISNLWSTSVAKVLCVDDDPVVISLKRKILEQAGYDVTTCNSADEAIREMERVDFDAVVTDWRLGRERGRAIVEAAKANSSVPVVVVSGFVAEAFQSGEPMADIYLEKPADPRELLQILQTLLLARIDRRQESSLTETYSWRE
jgi:two-component system response regulator GlrR